MASDPRVLVVQMGARRGYELARMLESVGALARLSTDAAVVEGRLNALRIASKFSFVAGALVRRSISGVDPTRVKSSIWPNLIGQGLAKFGVIEERRYRIEDWVLGQGVLADGLADANIVLNTWGNGGIGFLRTARRRGLKVVTDMIITPLAYDAVREERSKWPDWDNVSPAFEANAAVFDKHVRAILSVSDVLLCPSDNVAEAVEKLVGTLPCRVEVVPYGLGDIEARATSPIPKRVLFVGQASIRKGIPYLAEAARILNQADGHFDFRVAGGVPGPVRNQELSSSLTFLGHLSKQDLLNEYRQADVFCLPSVAEGMASATLEALAHGLPCIVTRECGSPVTDGVDGVIVRRGNPQELANSILRICADRAMRSAMSEAAVDKAKQHAFSAVAEKLHRILLGCLAAEGSSTR